MKTDSITKLADMYNSMGFQMFQSDKLSNNLFINDEERAKRIQEYAKNGCDGSMHAEIIQDWRDT